MRLVDLGPIGLGSIQKRRAASLVSLAGQSCLYRIRGSSQLMSSLA